MVALERLFAATPRGAALINRIKADPTLIDTEIRVISHDSDHTRVSARLRSPDAEPTVVLTTSRPIRSRSISAARGARRASRWRARLARCSTATRRRVIDLSTIGAQVVSSVVLKPNQVVRMALSDDHDSLRFNAAVAWASFEIPPNSGPRYRAGMKFIDADQGAVGGVLPAAQSVIAASPRAFITSSRMIVSSRSEPVETMAACTPDTSSSRAM